MSESVPDKNCECCYCKSLERQQAHARRRSEKLKRVDELMKRTGHKASLADIITIAAREGILPTGMVCQVAPEGTGDNILVVQPVTQEDNQVSGD